MEELKRYSCKTDGCRRAAFWLERDWQGERYLCFRERHDGRSHVQRVKLSDLAGIIRKAEAGVFDAHASGSGLQAGNFIAAVMAGTRAADAASGLPAPSDFLGGGLLGGLLPESK